MVEKKLFGYPTFDENGEEILSTYENEYRDMLMDVRIYRMAAGSVREFCREGEEIAVLLFSGEITFKWPDGEKTVSRESVFYRRPLGTACFRRCKDRSDRSEGFRNPCSVHT